MLDKELEKEVNNECIERLKILEKMGLLNNVRKEFEKDNTLYYAENTQLGGILYWVSNRDELVNAVEEVERDYDLKVFYAIESYTEFGKVFDMLVVTKDKEFWEDEKYSLKEGIAFSYCKNFTDEWCSEFGSIGIGCKSGGIVRVS